MNAAVEVTSMLSNGVAVKCRRGAMDPVTRGSLIFTVLIFVGLLPLVPMLILADQFGWWENDMMSTVTMVWPFVSVILGLALANWLLASQEKIVERQFIFTGDRVKCVGFSRPLKAINTLSVQETPSVPALRKATAGLISAVMNGLNAAFLAVFGWALPKGWKPGPAQPSYGAFVVVTQLPVFFTDANAAQVFITRLGAEIRRRRDKPVELVSLTGQRSPA